MKLFYTNDYSNILTLGLLVYHYHQMKIIRKIKPDISLLIHCLVADQDEIPAINPELFIKVGQLDLLLQQLKNDGYKFLLPHLVNRALVEQLRKDSIPVCYFTIDDGYYNNRLFLPLAEKYEIPFILFVNSFNVQNNIPFIWDIWKVTNRGAWHFSKHNYIEIYNSFSDNEKKLLYNDNYRPFTVNELKEFAQNKYAFIGLHTDSHQPLVGKQLQNSTNDLNKNIKFVEMFNQALEGDLSLPCGLHTKSTVKKLLKTVNRVYTTLGGRINPLSKVIDRISLVNPDIGGPLSTQIKRTFSVRQCVMNRLIVFRYSNAFASFSVDCVNKFRKR